MSLKSSCYYTNNYYSYINFILKLILSVICSKNLIIAGQVAISSPKNIPSSNSIPSGLLLKLIFHILETNPQCTSLNFVGQTFFKSPAAVNFDDSSASKITHVKSHIDLHILKKLEFSTSIVLTEFDGPLQSNTKINQRSNSKVAAIRSILWVTKYHSPCSIILLYDISNSSIYFHSDKHPSFYSSLPGAPHRTFHIFVIISRGKIQTEIDTNLIHTKHLQNVLILIDSGNAPNSIHLMTRNWDRTELIQIGSYNVLENNLTSFTNNNSGNNLWAAQEYLFPKYPNFARNPFVGHDTPFGVEYVEYFQSTGEWVIYTLDALWELCQDLNATCELVAEFSTPSNERSEDGEWDGFTAPLVDESHDFCGVLAPTKERKDVIYLSHPTFYDSVSFIHALPKKLGLRNSLWVLLDPLDHITWIGISISIILTFLSLELIFYCTEAGTEPTGTDYINGQWFKSINQEQSNNKNTRKRKIRITLFSLLKQCLDQDGLANPHFAQILKEKYSSLFIMTLWFLSLILLGSQYKSNLTSSIVLPKFISPPRTFPELIQSDFSINLMFFEVWRGRFNGVYEDIGKEILKRGVEVDYVEAGGYHLIFEGSQVIVGMTGVFNLLGITYLTNVKKQLLFMWSKDQIFSILGSVGFSKIHPYCVEPYDAILSRLESSGLSEYLLLKQQEFSRRKGLQNAHKWRARISQFNATAEDEETAASQLLKLVGILLFYGNCTALMAFLVEWIFKKGKKWYFGLGIVNNGRSCSIVRLHSYTE